MPVQHINGAPISFDETGAGEPLALIHGAWVDSSTWGFVVPGLAESFRVVTLDLRGHGRSLGAPEGGTVHDDVADVAALIATLDIAPVNLVGNSFGACIALRLTVEQPHLVRRTVVHEPPFDPLLAEDPNDKPILDEFTESISVVRQLLEAGDHARGAEVFVDTIALGPGGWAQIPAPIQELLVRHAPTFLGQLRDPDAFTIDVEALQEVSTPVLLSQGDQSPPMYGPIIEQLARRLPHAHRHTFAGAGHVPHLTHPTDYVAVVTQFLQST